MFPKTYFPATYFPGVFFPPASGGSTPTIDSKFATFVQDQDDGPLAKWSATLVDANDIHQKKWSRQTQVVGGTSDAGKKWARAI